MSWNLFQKQKNTGRILWIMIALLLVVELCSLSVLFSTVRSYSDTRPHTVIDLTEGGSQSTLEVTTKDGMPISQGVRATPIRLSAARVPHFEEETVNDPNGEKTGFHVYDEDKVWSTVTDVEIFHLKYDDNGDGYFTTASSDTDKVIAPGTGDTYPFTLSNTGSHNLKYILTVEAWFEGTDDLYIPVEARFSDYNHEYIVGGENSWPDVLELNSVRLERHLAPGTTADYSLDWRWPFERGDQIEEGLYKGDYTEDFYDTMLGNKAVDQDLVLHVVIRTWTEIDEEYNVEVILDLPTPVTDAVEVVPEGDTFTYTFHDVDGYNYVGYEIEGEYEVVSEDGDTLTIRPKSDIVIHVQYEQEKEYNVEVILDLPTPVTDAVEVVKDGDTFTYTFHDVDGYTYKDYYIIGDYEVVSEDGNTLTIRPKSDIIIHVQYENVKPDENYYDVEVILDLPTPVTDAVDVVKEGDTFTYTFHDVDGYTYKDFTITGDYELVSQDGNTITIRPKSDIVIHVQYEQEKEYNVEVILDLPTPVTDAVEVVKDGDTFTYTFHDVDGYTYSSYEIEGDYEVVSTDGNTITIRPRSDIVIHVKYKTAEAAPTKPRTGDNSRLTVWIVVSLVSLILLLVLLAFAIRDRRRSKHESES